MYTQIHLVSILITMLFSIYIGHKTGIKKGTTLLFTMFSFMVTYIILRVIPIFEYGEIGSLNMVKIYAFSPPVYYIAGKIFRIDFRTACDLHGIWPMLLFGLSHLACIPEGCCGSYQFAEGTVMYKIAFALTGTATPPNQLFESVAGLIICIAMFIIAYRHNFRMNGRLYFIMIIVYGVQRFFWEFLRNNNKIIVFGKMPGAVSGDLGLSDLSFYCIAMITVGIAFLIALHMIDKKKAQTNKSETNTETAATKAKI